MNFKIFLLYEFTTTKQIEQTPIVILQTTVMRMKLDYPCPLMLAHQRKHLISILRSYIMKSLFLTHLMLLLLLVAKFAVIVAVNAAGALYVMVVSTTVANT